MSVTLERRRLLQLAAFGAGAVALNGRAYAQIVEARGFTHGVASGEPQAKSVLLWTRYVPPAGGSAQLRWEISQSDDFQTVLLGGAAEASGERDYCVKAVAGGLKPDRWYFYRFRDSRGQLSPVGRTRTMPQGRARHFKLALFSCSNIAFGWFNAYAHAAERKDLDLAVHVGDYFYEYEPGRYPLAAETVRPEVLEPRHETIALADYRLRYAAYRSDPDLQRLHQALPMIAMWDDHESANNSWQGGAVNHTTNEGTWEDRKAAAIRAYHEWMPVAEAEPRSYDIGRLATIVMPETRLTGRSRPIDIRFVAQGKTDIAAALTRFRDERWQDPARTMLGADQEQWLTAELKASRHRKATWQILAQQVLMGPVAIPFELESWVPAGAIREDKARAQLLVAASRLGLPMNFDSWDGFPAARERLFQASLTADANLLVLSGDSHNAWANDLVHGTTPVGVEIGGQSVTSPGNERDLPHLPPGAFSRALVSRNPHLKWANNHQRGYATVELTPERATAEWLFLATVRQRSTAIAATHRMTTLAGSRRFAP